MNDVRCPCGLPATFDDCCGRFHAGAAAPTAETLMRSRYSAFAVGDVSYLLATWDPAGRPGSLDADEFPAYSRLDVLATTGGGLFDREGTVSFRAHHADGVLAENSRFRRVDGRWVYVDAVRSVHDP